MISSLARPLAAALILAAATPALAEDQISDADKAEITTMLTEMGYEVRKIDYDNGNLEAYVVKDGQATELVLEQQYVIVDSLED